VKKKKNLGKGEEPKGWNNEKYNNIILIGKA